MHEEDFLQLSGIQHYAYCPRSWALIHIEGLWIENFFTASGRALHDNAHDPYKAEKRGNIITVRALRVFSHSLGISGECDVVEFCKNPQGIALHNWEGKYLPFPVEYKRGKRADKSFDKLQLCAQAMCLEEMLCCKIQSGALFYGQDHGREVVEFEENMRQEVKEICQKMHQLNARQHTPKVKEKQKCTGCSLYNVCLSTIFKKQTPLVDDYLKENLP